MAATTVLTTKWKYCAFVSLSMVVLSMIPQLHLWIVRGRNWNGAYVSSFVDEPYYAAYVNALKDRRTRRNDPFGAKDDSSERPLPESIYSIQFVPAYLVAQTARLFRVSVSTAFIILTPIAALLASLSVFWLLFSVTKNSLLAASGTLFVLCLGGLFGSYGIFQSPIDVAIPVLPFLRRYQPAVAFPLYFVFSVLVWYALTSERKRSSRLCALLAGCTMAVLIFSYLYLWTAAAAWLACFGLLWLYFRPANRRDSLSALAIIGSITVSALVPYFFLLSKRAAVTDEQQIMVATRIPELFHIHEIIAGLILIALVAGVAVQRISVGDPRVIYVASLALLPFVVFNQQVLTGRTLQAFHFEIYSVNYSVTVAVLLAITIFRRVVSQRLLVWTAALSFCWGLIAIVFPAQAIGVDLAVADDRRIPTLRHLKELSKQDGTLSDLRTHGQSSNMVFSPSVSLITLLPSWTSQGTLLDITGGDCAGVTREQRKHFYYMHLYYSKVETDTIRLALSGPQTPPRDETLTIRNLVFGHARIFPRLSSRFDPVQPDEIEHEVQNYQAFIGSFSRDVALKRPITYAVIPAESNFDFTNLDRWYDRDAGERVGDYVLFRLKLRP